MTASIFSTITPQWDISLLLPFTAFQHKIQVKDNERKCKCKEIVQVELILLFFPFFGRGGGRYVFAFLYHESSDIYVSMLSVAIFPLLLVKFICNLVLAVFVQGAK